MKPSAAGRKSAPAKTARARATPGLIHPVIIYPFRTQKNLNDLKELYSLVAQLAAQPGTYARPITVIDQKTRRTIAANKSFADFRRNTIARHSDILDAWCVDTCQMWYTGLGAAHERGGPRDTYWLIPGDFNYGSPVGREVLSRLHDLPEICGELGQDICVGEIATDHNNPKQLIDTYGTFALLYNWFPAEARELREFTERPRSEFFALRHAFLGEMLHRRWYAYEQTVVLLLHAIFHRKTISRFFVGHITDLPEGRETLDSAMQQVERTERVLKNLWRERHAAKARWSEQYCRLETRSGQVRRTALTILENLLA